jgi:RNA polymerase sigma-70 factor (ECF subfamily)
MFFEQSNFHQTTSWFKMGSGSIDRNLEITEENFVAQTILQRIASGDQTAVQECLDTYGGLIWSLARRMLPDVNEAEDAVQEIFIEIWKTAERFDESKSSETTYVAMIARRRLIDRLRKTTRQPNIDSFEDILVEPSKNEDQQIQMSIEAKQAAEAMRDLRPEQQKVLQLSIVQGYSHQEISDALKMPLGTVKTHARRGLMQVREFLEQRNPDTGKEVSA